MKGLEAIIFDLDGTLLDTIDDLADSCNMALKKNRVPERTRDEIQAFVGNGLGMLIERAIPDGRKNTLYGKILSDMRDIYSRNWHNRTRPYDGIMDMLKGLSEHNVQIGIVSNKPDAQVKELAGLFFDGLVDVRHAVGEKESEGIKRKPAPDSVLHVLDLMCVDRSKAVYAGDSDVDVMTARNAGMECISVCWGFRTRDFLVSNGAKILVEKPDEILELCLQLGN